MSFTLLPTPSESRVLYFRGLGVVLHPDLGWELGHMELTHGVVCNCVFLAFPFFFFGQTIWRGEVLSLSDQGWNRAPAVAVHSPTHWTTREVSSCFTSLGLPGLHLKNKIFEYIYMCS